MDRTACTEPQCLYKGAFYLYLYLLITTTRCSITQKSAVLIYTAAEA